MGLRELQYTRRLRPSEEKAKLYPKWKILQGMTSCYTSGSQKAKGKSLPAEAKPQLKVKGRLNYLAFLFTVQGLC
jgi:hypothetical protein